MIQPQPTPTYDQQNYSSNLGQSGNYQQPQQPPANTPTYQQQQPQQPSYANVFGQSNSPFQDNF